MNLIDSHDTFRYLETCNGDISKLEMAVLFQMMYVGTPHIWYGDEVGMMGGHDPDCRRPFDWNYTQDPIKVSLQNHYKKLIQIRKDHSSLRTGTFKTLIADDMVYGFERSDSESTIKVILNNDTKFNKIILPSSNYLYIDLLSGNLYRSDNGEIEIDMPPMSGLILK